ncbi:MAG: hypothetical protein ACRD3J_22775, partial [Thermoanaerobaculia bacterium]
MPTPPPFPFQFLGKLVQGSGAEVIYLAKGQALYRVVPGDMLEGAYRVEKVGRDYLEVTYLPLDKKQTVAFSSIAPAPGLANQAFAPNTAPIAMAQASANPDSSGQQADSTSASVAGGSALGSVRGTISESASGIAAPASTTSAPDTAVIQSSAPSPVQAQTSV